MDGMDEQLLSVPSPTAPEPAGDNRLHGDSIESVNPRLGWSSTTATSSVDSCTVTTPATSHPMLRRISSPGLVPHELFGLSPDDKERSTDDQQQSVAHAGRTFQLTSISVPYHHKLRPRNSSKALDDVFWTWW